MFALPGRILQQHFYTDERAVSVRRQGSDGIEIMNLLNIGVYVLTCVGTWTKVSGFEVKHGGEIFKYRISDMKKCPESGTVFRRFVGISLDECVYNCGIRTDCRGLNYKRRYKMCELRSDDANSENKVKGCVYVKWGDISGIQVIVSIITYDDEINYNYKNYNHSITYEEILQFSLFWFGRSRNSRSTFTRNFIFTTAVVKFSAAAVNVAPTSSLF